MTIDKKWQSLFKAFLLSYEIIKNMLLLEFLDGKGVFVLQQVLANFRFFCQCLS